MRAAESILKSVPRDVVLLFLTRFIRLFAYGSLSVVLVLYLTSLGLTESQTGLLLTLILAGDTAVSLLLSTQADRIGRRRMLITGALLMTAAGLAFAYTSNFLFLVIAGTIGVISPSGNQVGPFLPIEQAALSQVVPAQTRTRAFAWYTLAGAFATAAGSLAGGILPELVPSSRTSAAVNYRSVVILYALLGLLLAVLFTRLSHAAEVDKTKNAAAGLRARLLGLGGSRRVVL